MFLLRKDSNDHLVQLPHFRDGKTGLEFESNLLEVYRKVSLGIELCLHPDLPLGLSV